MDVSRGVKNPLKLLQMRGIEEPMHQKSHIASNLISKCQEVMPHVVFHQMNRWI